MKIAHLSVLKIAVCVVLLMHGVPGFFNNGISLFGKEYLDKIGFAPFGLILASIVKISHIAYVFALRTNRFLTLFTWINIITLVVGICILHIHSGWYVVGPGRNGVEFNVLLIASLLAIDLEKKE